MRDSFVMYTAYAEKFKQLSDEQFGILIRGIISYQTTGIAPVFDDVLLSLAFDVAKVEIDAANEKYEKVCERRKEAALKGGRPKKEKDASENQKVSKKPNGFSKTKCKHNDNENENDNDNDNDISTKVDIGSSPDGEDIKKPLHHSANDGIATPHNPDMFDHFWKKYPRKVGKGAAIKSWNRIKPNNDLANKIIQAVENNASGNPQWKRDNGQFIPHPATWLNQGRWDDDIGTEPKEKPPDRSKNNFMNFPQRDHDTDYYAELERKKLTRG